MTQLSLNPAANLDQQVQDVLWNRAGKRRLELHERDVLQMLRNHHGLEQARPLADFATALNLTPRAIKGIVKTLIEEFDLPIGASRQEPYGYYLCVTAEDIEAAAGPLVAELLSLARRIRKLRGKERFMELLGQMRMEREQ